MSAPNTLYHTMPQSPYGVLHSPLLAVAIALLAVVLAAAVMTARHRYSHG